MNEWLVEHHTLDCTHLHAALKTLISVIF